MYRGTTPTLQFKLNGTIDLTLIDKLALTIENNNHKYSFDLGDVDLDYTNKIISLTLTQEQTLKLTRGIAKCQFRIKMNDGSVVATHTTQFSVDEILKEEIL